MTKSYHSKALPMMSALTAFFDKGLDFMGDTISTKSESCYKIKSNHISHYSTYLFNAISPLQVTQPNHIFMPLFKISIPFAKWVKQQDDTDPNNIVCKKTISILSQI